MHAGCNKITKKSSLSTTPQCHKNAKKKFKVIFLKKLLGESKRRIKQKIIRTSLVPPQAVAGY